MTISSADATQLSARTVPCPQCGNEALFSPKNAYRPFCSKRCKLIDFGAWSNESYRVPSPEKHTDHDADIN